MSERVIAIVGGGLSGLATAEAVQRRSSEAGIPTRAIVLEAESAPGGKIRSSRVSGFVVDTGPHGFLDKEPKMFELIDRLGIRSSMIAANTASARRFIMRAGKLREVPSSPPHFLFSDILPLGAKLRVALEPLMPGPPEGDESVWDFAARRIGPVAANVLVDAMVTGIYGGDPRRLSLKSAFPRMHELERDHGSLFKAQLAVARERKRQRALASGTEVVPQQQGTGAPVGTLHSFREGLGTLIDALSARAEVRADESVQRVQRTGEKWQVFARGEVLEADAVVSAVPAYVAEPLVGPLAQDLATTLGKIAYVPCSVVVQGYLQKDVRRPLNGFGYLVPGGEQRDVLGAIWASTVFPEHAPSGMVMFRSMLGGARRPDLGQVDEAELADRARRELEAWVGLREGAEPVVERVIPWPKAIPQYEVGHASKVEAADAVERQFPGLFVSGNAYRGVAVLACVAQADLVAERAVRFLSSREAVPAPPPSPTHHEAHSPPAG